MDSAYSANCSVAVKSTVSEENATATVFMQITPHSWQEDVHFAQANYEGFVVENGAAGSLVMTNTSSQTPLQLSILPRPSNGKVLGEMGKSVKYRILSPREPYFAIDSTSGTIRNVNPVDFEEVGIDTTFFFDLTGREKCKEKWRSN
jgi:hypothetical protein